MYHGFKRYSQKVVRQMQTSLMVGVYFISGSWNDFVSTHKLCATDVIRFFKSSTMVLTMTAT